MKFAIQLFILFFISVLRDSSSKKSIELSPLLELRVTEQIGVGTPPQNMLFIYDTGSPFLYVPSSSCESCIRRNRQIIKFNPSQSSTFKFQSEGAEVIYGEGATGKGSEIEEVITFDEWVVPLDHIYLIHEENQMNNSVFDGIMGLSNSKEYKNIFEVGYQEGLLESSLFGFYWGSIFLKEKSYFYYNFTKDHFQDIVYYEDSSFYEYWTLQISALYFQEKKIPISEAILDTGAPVITFPSSVFEKLYEEFFSPYCKQTDEQIWCSCEYSVFPDIEMYVGVDPFTHLFVIPSTAYLQPRVETEYLFYKIGQRKGECLLLLSGTNRQGPKTSLVGFPFFSGRRVVFDKKKNQIGIGTEEVRLRNFIKSKNAGFLFQILSYLICILFGFFFLFAMLTKKLKFQKKEQELTGITSQKIDTQNEKK